jgi:chemotaxis protein CheD
LHHLHSIAPKTNLGSQNRVVGIADYAVSNSPLTVLATHSLGSCLGIVIYDPVVKVGGMVHVMLPDSELDPIKASAQPAMFIDTGIPILFRSAYKFGADKHRMQVYVAGGAQVMDNGGFFNIGKRNYEAFMNVCRKHNLRISAEQVGGLVSRSIYLRVATGDVWLRISGQSKEFPLCKNSMTT